MRGDKISKTLTFSETWRRAGATFAPGTESLVQTGKIAADVPGYARSRVNVTAEAAKVSALLHPADEDDMDSIGSVRPERHGLLDVRGP